MSYSPWDRKELDRNRRLSYTQCVWGTRINTTGTTLFHTCCNTGSNFVLNGLRWWVSVLRGVSNSSDSNLKGVLLALKLEECTSQPEAQPVDVYETPLVCRHWAGCWLCSSYEGRQEPFLRGVYNPVKKAAIEKRSHCHAVLWGHLETYQCILLWSGGAREGLQGRWHEMYVKEKFGKPWEEGAEGREL